MSRQTLKDANYRIVGYIETDTSGRQTGKDANYRIVGYYQPRADQTTNANSRVIAHGNVLSSLVYSAC